MSTINPGSWAIEAPKQIDIPISAVGLYGERVIVARVPFGSKVHAESNARLVAAAPNMLEALETALREMEYVRKEYHQLTGVGVLLQSIEMARNAISRATGEAA
jgi:hypothetical protein